MKRIALFLCIAIGCAGIGKAAFQSSIPEGAALSKYVPAGPLLYLEAKDFSSMLKDWNASPQKAGWLESDNYEVFSRSRLFLRLKTAGVQFAIAAGLPPDMDFVSQVAGSRSALAVYDIGKLQFLYIAYLPSAHSMQTTLWQTCAKFEPRNAGGVDFYLRRDPDSQREIAFAISGDYLMLATREDLIASALELMAGKQDRSVETERWWAQSTAAAGAAGDLRLVLNMQSLVPNGYFRTYWVQQNISDLSQYSSAVSDLSRSGNEYREERVLIRKKEPERANPAETLAAVADIARLVPDGAGLYEAMANPTPNACFALLETKLLAPHLGPEPISRFAPQVQITSGESGSSSDLETRINQPPVSNPSGPNSGAELKALLDRTPLLAALQVQSSATDPGDVFVRMHSAVILESAADWNEAHVQTAIAEFAKSELTASDFGLGWLQQSGYSRLDGLWPLAVAVRGRYLVVADDAGLMESVLANFSRKPDRKPSEFLAGFSHARERTGFSRFARLVARPNTGIGSNPDRQPQFFSGNMASLSKTLAELSSERIEIRSDGGKVRQTVTYEWSH
jgi:hypothetical protein